MWHCSLVFLFRLSSCFLHVLHDKSTTSFKQLFSWSFNVYFEENILLYLEQVSIIWCDNSCFFKLDEVESQECFVTVLTILLSFVVLKNVFQQCFLSVELVFWPLLPDMWTFWALEHFIRVSFHMVGEAFSWCKVTFSFTTILIQSNFSFGKRFPWVNFGHGQLVSLLNKICLVMCNNETYVLKWEMFINLKCYLGTPP